MPRQQQVGSLRQWGSKFLDFMNMASRAIPLFVLHWYSQNDYPALLRHQIISDEGGAYLHGLLFFFLHVVAFAATVSNSCVLLGLHLVSFALVQSNLPWLEESRQKFAALVTELEPDSGNPVDLNGPSDIRIKALYGVLLQVFVGLAALRFPNVSVLRSSTSLSPFRVLTLGPVISTMVLAIFPEDYLAYRSYFLPSVLIVTLLCEAHTSWEVLGIENSIARLRADADIYLAHQRRSIARLERLKVSRIFSLFFIFRMIEIAVRISAEGAPASMPSTWFGLGEELLHRSCDTTVSIIGFASVSITGIRYFMGGVRDVLRLQSAGEELKGDFFLLFFSLAVFAKAPLSNHRVGLDCLSQFLCLYVLSWMNCIVPRIFREFESLGRLPNIRAEQVLRQILALVFVWITFYALECYCIATPLTTSLMLIAGSKMAATLILFMLLPARGDRVPLSEIIHFLRLLLIDINHITFLVQYLIATCLLDPEAFFGFDLRIFTDRVNASALKALQQAAALAIEFRDATPEELARGDQTCPICLEEMESAAVTVCSHIFHLDCLRSWIQSNMSCPMCRMPVDRKRQ